MKENERIKGKNLIFFYWLSLDLSISFNSEIK